MPKIHVIKVDRDVPVPAEVPLTHYPLRSLEVGDSFAFPLEKRNSVAPVATKLKNETGREFIIRKTDDTTARIWRTK